MSTTGCEFTQAGEVTCVSAPGSSSPPHPPAPAAIALTTASAMNRRVSRPRTAVGMTGGPRRRATGCIRPPNSCAPGGGGVPEARCGPAWNGPRLAGSGRGEEPLDPLHETLRTEGLGEVVVCAEFHGGV